MIKKWQEIFDQIAPPPPPPTKTTLTKKKNKCSRIERRFHCSPWNMFVCVLVCKRDSVFGEIPLSSTSSLWVAITKKATVWCFYYFTLRLCNPFLEAISRRVFIKMLCDKCFLVTYVGVYVVSIRSCPSAFVIIYAFFLLIFAFVICWMNGCRGRIFLIVCINVCVCAYVYFLMYIFLFPTFVYTLSQWKLWIESESSLENTKCSTLTRRIEGMTKKKYTERIFNAKK